MRAPLKTVIVWLGTQDPLKTLGEALGWITLTRSRKGREALGWEARPLKRYSSQKDRYPRNELCVKGEAVKVDNGVSEYGRDDWSFNLW